MKTPLVSIIMSTRNRSQLLIRAINSIINQTYDHIELIIVDDASEDDTPDVLKKLSKKIEEVK